MSGFCIVLVPVTFCFLQRGNSILHRKLHPWHVNLDIRDVTSQVSCLSSFFTALTFRTSLSDSVQKFLLGEVLIHISVIFKLLPRK